MTRWVIAFCCVPIGALLSGCAFAGASRLASPPTTSTEERVAQATTVSSLAAHERAALWRGDVVARRLSFSQGDNDYVGGIAYLRVPLSADRVYRALLRVEALREAIPRTKRAELVARAGDTYRVELTQGNAWIDATYTVTIVPDAERREIRFALDPSRPHDIDALYGFFRAVPLGPDESAIVCASLVDIGGAVLHRLFASRVQRLLLGAPTHVRAYLRARDTDGAQRIALANAFDAAPRSFSPRGSASVNQ